MPGGGSSSITISTFDIALAQIVGQRSIASSTIRSKSSVRIRLVLR